jgi:hypothetical protein
MCQELLFMQMVLVLGHFVSPTATQQLSELLKVLSHWLELLKLKWKAG